MNKEGIRKLRRLFEIVEVGNDLDWISRAYDYFNVSTIVLNLIASILYTYDGIREQYGTLLLAVEIITAFFFAVDYALRLITSRFLYPELTKRHALRKYALSFMGVVDLLSFLPYFLPVFFPAGTVAFRMIRIVRIFRLFKINAYYDSLHVIAEVINGRRQQLLSSVFIILVLMLASSLCMYSLEHEAQPDVFRNAFSGIWWATSTLLTVGYGDIYPITTWGKLFGIFISFLGVGMVAIPTGIISAGFVNQYSTIKKRSEYGYESAVRFMKLQLDEDDRWVGKSIADLELSPKIIVAAVKRNEKLMVPRGEMILKIDDTLILGAEPYEDREQIELKEIVLQKKNPWVNKKISALDISRHSVIVLIQRKDKVLIPNGDMVLREGDNVFLYTQLHLDTVSEIDL